MKKFNCLFGILLFTTFTFFASCSGEKENNQDKDKETTHLLRFSPQDGDNYDISFVMNMEGLMDMSMGMECFQKVLSVDGDEIDFKMDKKGLFLLRAKGVTFIFFQKLKNALLPSHRSILSS